MSGLKSHGRRGQGQQHVGPRRPGRKCNSYCKSNGKWQRDCGCGSDGIKLALLKEPSGRCVAQRLPGDTEGAAESRRGPARGVAEPLTHLSPGALSPCCVVGTAGHVSGKEDEEMRVLTPAGARVSGKGSALLGRGAWPRRPVHKPESPSCPEGGGDLRTGGRGGAGGRRLTAAGASALSRGGFTPTLPPGARLGQMSSPPSASVSSFVKAG